MLRRKGVSRHDPDLLKAELERPFREFSPTDASQIQLSDFSTEQRKTAPEAKPAGRLDLIRASLEIQLYTELELPAGQKPRSAGCK